MSMHMFSIAQSDFREGYLLLKSKDTLYGYIDFRGAEYNAHKCVFKKDLNSDPDTYLPIETKEYKIYEGKYYVSELITIDSTKTHVFLEYLVDGIADLYYFQKEGLSYYYIKNENQKPILLEESEDIIEKEGIKYYKKAERHKGILKFVFRDCEEIQDKINLTSLNHKSLVSLTKEYHAQVCTDEKCINYYKSVKSSVKLGFLIGMHYHSIAFLKNDVLEQGTFNYNENLSFKVMGTLQPVKMNRRYMLRFELGFLDSYNYENINDVNSSNIAHYDVHVKLQTLNFFMGLKYKFPKGFLRPTFSIGPEMYYHISDDSFQRIETEINNTITTGIKNNLPINSFNFGGTAKMGTYLHINEYQSILIELGYSYLFGEIASTYNIMNGIQLHLGMIIDK